ncbi:30S ribosomal protein S1 [Irregularibacter muris]|uniref:30S ribosomal protein S1 n=1 Tax=Irregularibacter muris TaxID=1796619 RepID=A0AAE3HF93_9FIRM|nr:30S ribosomal protein S1 [Irregularibacter muris]MCR1898063.1 30S ribosomal protein S1 [Irregularibacter muris]
MERELVHGENKNNEELSFQKSLEQTIVNIKPGDIIEGDVISINTDEIVVNIGYKADGVIRKSDFSNKDDIILSEVINPGEKVNVMVLSLNDDQGNVILSKRKVDEKIAEEKIKNAYEKEEILRGKIIKSIKGGFIVDIGDKEVFMPISHYHVKFIKNPELAVNEDVRGKIIEYNIKNNRIIFSQKVVLQEEQEKKKKEVLENLEEGKIVSGTVKSIVKFGAFIDLGGVDGLIHISDLSWGRTNKPEDVLSIGDIVKTKVMEVNKDTGKVKLSLKHLVEEPWAKVLRIHTLGDKIKAKVVKITAFGAFAEIIPGVEGLIHKSQISFEPVEKVEDYLKPGQEVEVQIIDMDKDKRKIGLSMTALQDKPVKKIQENETVYAEEDTLTLGDVFGSMFKE